MGVLLYLLCSVLLGLARVGQASTGTVRGSVLELNNMKSAIESPPSTSLSIESTKKSVKVGVMTWNLAERSPTPEDCNFITELSNTCDVIALGLQECEDIRPRRKEGRRSRKWKQLRKSLLPKQQFKCLGEHRMGGMQLAVYLRKSLRHTIKGVQTIEVPCGVGNVLTNKGAICIVLKLESKETMAFINAHLAAHQEKVLDRNANYDRIMKTIDSKLFSRWRRKPTSTALTIRGMPPRKRGQISRKKTSRNRPYGNEYLEQAMNIINPTKTTIKRANAKEPSITRSRSAAPECDELFDNTFFFGDLNYRMDLPKLEIELFCNRFRQHDAEESDDDEHVNDGDDKLSQKESSPSHVASSGSMPSQQVARMRFHVPSENQQPQLERRLSSILSFDQLVREMRRKRAFVGFQELPIRFPPTFKYDKRSSFFDSKKGRCPAWTDRVLYHRSKASQQPVHATLQPVDYCSYDVRTSDHRPVCATFEYTYDVTPSQVQANTR